MRWRAQRSDDDAHRITRVRVEDAKCTFSAMNGSDERVSPLMNHRFRQAIVSNELLVPKCPFVDPLGIIRPLLAAARTGGKMGAIHFEFAFYRCTHPGIGGLPDALAVQIFCVCTRSDVGENHGMHSLLSNDRAVGMVP